MRKLILVSLSIALTCLSACQSKQHSGSDKTKGSEDGPMLTKPSVRKVWVPPSIEDGGRTYRDGHFIYILDKETTWSR